MLVPVKSWLEACSVDEQLNPRAGLLNWAALGVVQLVK